jgi:hypothetical protein
MTKRKLVLGIAIVALVAGMLATLGASGGQKESGVRVPVIFDGALYGPEEFNAIHQKLNSQGIDLIFVLQEGQFYAFSTMEEWHQYAAEQDSLAYPQSVAEMEVSITSGSADYYFTQNYEHTYWQGECIWVYYTYWLPNLSDYGFNDKISSVIVTCNPNLRDYCLFANKDYGGAYLLLARGQAYSALAPYGFNDRASSIKSNTY